jgi:hypothetical protein
MGRALRTVPAVGENQIVIDRRGIYDECNIQAYSVIIRTFTTENSGFVIPVVLWKMTAMPFGKCWSSSIMVLRLTTSQT